MPRKSAKRAGARRRAAQRARALATGNKYGARRVVVDGITFDSTGESRRYLTLKAEQEAGRISGLTVHPRYALDVNGVRVCEYVGDFAYVSETTLPPLLVLEDVKGFRTPVYRLKKKLLWALKRLAVREVTPLGKERMTRRQRLAAAKLKAAARAAKAAAKMAARKAKAAAKAVKAVKVVKRPRGSERMGTKTKYRCVVCGKLTAGRLPKSGDLLALYPRYHKYQGKPCAGNERAAEVVAAEASPPPMETGIKEAT